MAFTLGQQDLKVVLDLQVKNQQAITNLQKDIGILSRNSTALSQGFGKLATAAKALAASFIAREIISFSKSILDIGDELNKASQKTGIAVEELAKLRTGAELAGLSFEGLQGGLKKLSTALIEADAGNRSMQQALSAVGISGKELKGIGLDAAVGKIADAFNKSADGPAKAALAVKLFGKSGTEIIPFLNQGIEGIKRFGLAIDQEFAEAAERFNDDLKLMQNSLVNLGVTIIGPNLKPLLDFFYDLAGALDVVITRIRQTAAYVQGLGSVFGIGDKKRIDTFLEIHKLEEDLIKRSRTLGVNQYGVRSGGAKGTVELPTPVSEKKARVIERENAGLREQIDLLVQVKEEEDRTYGAGARQSIQEYTDAASNSAALTKSAMLGTFQELEDALVNFVRTGKLNFQDLADFVINEMIRMSVKQGVIAPFLRVVGGLFSGAAGPVNTTGGAYGDFGTYSAKGNIVGPNGPLPLEKYARGGIARSPQISIFGEGSTPEAYVPLPDGRRIPVVMKGGGGGVNIGSINVSMNGDSSVESSQEKGKMAGKLLVAAIQQEVIKMQRPGGLLAGTR